MAYVEKTVAGVRVIVFVALKVATQRFGVLSSTILYELKLGRFRSRRR